MSEKQMWQLLELYQWHTGQDRDGAWECALCEEDSFHRSDCRIGKALSEPPDVVVLLRKLSKMQASYETVLDDSLKGSYSLEEAVGRSFEKGVLSTTIGIIELIQAVFHVRLTADGWEWVD